MLPQDIIDLIIDEFASTEDKTSLQVCNSVSRAFSARSRQQLFANIELIADGAVQRRAGRLRKILEADPDLAPRIRSFKLIVGPFSKALDRGIETFGKVLGSRRLGKLGCRVGIQLKTMKNHLFWLLQTISQVSQVPKFVLEGDTSYMDWMALPTHVQNLLLRLCSKPQLQALELLNIYNLPAAIVTGNTTHAGSIRHLKLRNSSFTLSAAVNLNQNSMYLSKLRTLELAMNHSRSVSYQFRRRPQILDGDFIQMFPNHIPFLTDLAVGLTSKPDNVDSMWHLAITGAQTIEYLELRVYGVYFPPLISAFEANYCEEMTTFSPIWSLSDMVALKNLKITAYSFYYLEFDIGMDFIARFLQSPVSQVPLRSFTLDFYFQLLSPREPTDLTCPDVRRKWEILDEALSSSNFPDLQEVLVNFRVPQFDDFWDADEICDAAKMLNGLYVFKGNRVDVKVKEIDEIYPLGRNSRSLSSYSFTAQEWTNILP
ncbi:hypothetical protein GALMADRAFT_206195 [Galerina marginata CBS 339.88]|uniref:F-box domain-containing protein n=1 Tax=Galerina marginata (strain CBS 339.88) TaxID=685588 RepID=A0A067U019_GALM3|nr:hypothetical protein GALMADRAFT_206195 [Galerina marginata CBS 339.88]